MVASIAAARSHLVAPEGVEPLLWAPYIDFLEQYPFPKSSQEKHDIVNGIPNPLPVPWYAGTLRQEVSSRDSTSPRKILPRLVGQ